MMNCTRCGTTLQPSAAYCSNCGQRAAPLPKRLGLGKALIYAAAAVVLFGLVFNQKSFQNNYSAPRATASTSKPTPKPATPAAPPPKACAATDLQCLGDENSLYADSACKPLVESRAKWQYEWIDGWLEGKFPSFRWFDASTQTIQYLGDKIKFQNGFGAWQRVQYACNYNIRTKSATVMINDEIRQAPPKPAQPAPRPQVTVAEVDAAGVDYVGDPTSEMVCTHKDGSRTFTDKMCPRGTTGKLNPARRR